MILDKIVILPSKRNSFGDFKDELQVNINRDGYGLRPVLRKIDSKKLNYTNTESQKKTGIINFQKIQDDIKYSFSETKCVAGDYSVNKSPSMRSTSGADMYQTNRKHTTDDKDHDYTNYVSPPRSTHGTTQYMIRTIDAKDIYNRNGSSGNKSAWGEGWQSPPNLLRKFNFEDQIQCNGLVDINRILQSPRLKPQPSLTPPRSPDYHKIYQTFNEMYDTGIGNQQQIDQKDKKPLKHDFNPPHKPTNDTYTHEYIPQAKILKRETREEPISNLEKNKSLTDQNTIINTNRQQQPQAFVDKQSNKYSTFTTVNLVNNIPKQYTVNKSSEILHSISSINDDYYEIPYLETMYDTAKSFSDVLSDDQLSPKLSPQAVKIEDCQEQATQKSSQITKKTNKASKNNWKNSTKGINELPCIEERPEDEEMYVSNLSRFQQFRS